MTEDLLVYCPSSMFSKTCTFLWFYILWHMFSVVLKETRSASMQFFHFFDVLKRIRISITTGVTLILLIFFWFLSLVISICHFFLLFFANFYVSRYSNINYGTNFLILIHYNIIWFPCLDFSVTLDHKVPQNLHLFNLGKTFWSMFMPFFSSF